MTTDAQTEARAIAPDREHYEAANKIWRLSVVECKHAIATALAAKDAELAAVRTKANYWQAEYLNACRDAASFSDDLLRAEAQLAEVRKALDKAETRVAELLDSVEFSSIENFLEWQRELRRARQEEQEGDDE